MPPFDIATWDAVVYPPDSDTETRFRPVNLAILALARAGLISVAVSETAPDDTSVIWLDPALNDNANGTVKIHNGTAWVAATKALLLRHLGGITQADVDAEIAAVVGTATEAFDSFGEIVTALNGKADTVHTHSQAQVTDLVADLAGKQPLSAALTTLSSATAAGLALMDDADAAAQRTTLGLRERNHG